MGGDLLGRRFVAALLEHPALHPDDPVDQLDDVDRDPDGAGLVGEGAGHGLADPPGRVRRELVAAGVVELLDRPDQAEVALLDEVEHGQAAADVPLGDGDDEAQVRLDQPALGHPAHDDQPVEVEGELAVRGRGRRASFSSANRPASTRRASSTSSAAVSSGMRPISRRYWRNRSEEGLPVSARGRAAPAARAPRPARCPSATVRRARRAARRRLGRVRGDARCCGAGTGAPDERRPPRPAAGAGRTAPVWSGSGSARGRPPG